MDKKFNFQENFVFTKNVLNATKFQYFDHFSLEKYQDTKSALRISRQKISVEKYQDTKSGYRDHHVLLYDVEHQTGSPSDCLLDLPDIWDNYLVLDREDFQQYTTLGKNNNNNNNKSI